jgi:hypothetical protein
MLTAFVLSLPLTLPTKLGVLTLTPCDQWGPEITNDPEMRDRAHFKPFVLGGTNHHNDNDNPKYWTLDSLMSSQQCACDFLLYMFLPLIGLLSGHTFINILKINIKGGGFDALATFLTAHAKDDAFPIGHLQLKRGRRIVH